jgi:hypothetical protein
MNLYHLSPVENIDAIQNEGIRASDDGAIYAFTHMVVANTVARDQVFTDRYAIFRILTRGVSGEVLPDNVAEFASPFQRRIMQQRIEVGHVHLLGVREVIVDRPTEFDFLVGEQIFRQNRSDVREEFAMRRRSRDAWLAKLQRKASG